MDGLLGKAQKIRETFVLTLDTSGRFNARLEAVRDSARPVASGGLLRKAENLLRSPGPGLTDAAVADEAPGIRGDADDLAELPESLPALEAVSAAEPLEELVAETAPPPATDSTAEDQADIIRQIEEVVAANKIKVTPELFTLQARHSGNRLPLFVNLAAAALLVLGIGVMYLVFNQGQREQSRQVVQLKSAEGKLIEEIKKQNEASMAAKQREISDIQTQLGAIAQQRDSLAADMNAKVDARAAELKKDMDSKLAEERKRLAGQGLSEGEIQKRLTDFEKQKTAEYDALLDAFRIQAENTRKKNEAELKAREEQFNQSLAQVNQEKERIASEAKKREDELRKQLEAQNSQAAAQATAQAKQDQAALDAAAAQISKLAQGRDQERQVGTQIAGFYGTVRDQLRDRKLDQATETLRLLKDYLNSSQVTGMDSLKQRRETDLFVVDALGNYIDKERRGNDSAASNALVAAEAVKAQEAATAALKDAQAKYEAQLAKLQQEADSSQRKLQDLLASQEKANREQLAVRDGSITELTAARDALKLQVDGLNGDLSRLRVNNDGLAKTIADLERTVAAQKADIDNQKAIIASASGSQTDLGERIRALEAQITELKTANQATADQLAARGLELDRTRTSLQSAQQERDQAMVDSKSKDAQLSRYADDLAKLTVVANTYSGMVQAWTAYVQADRDLRQRLVAPATAEATRDRETKVLLDSFLAGDLVRNAFPDLLERIKAYDKVFENSGKENVTLDLADQVYTVSSFEGRQERLDYLADQVKKAANPGVKEFWQNVLDLVRTQPAE